MWVQPRLLHLFQTQCLINLRSVLLVVPFFYLFLFNENLRKKNDLTHLGCIRRVSTLFDSEPKHSEYVWHLTTRTTITIRDGSSKLCHAFSAMSLPIAMQLRYDEISKSERTHFEAIHFRLCKCHQLCSALKRDHRYSHFVMSELKGKNIVF